MSTPGRTVPRHRIVIAKGRSAVGWHLVMVDDDEVKVARAATEANAEAAIVSLVADGLAIRLSVPSGHPAWAEPTPIIPITDGGGMDQHVIDEVVARAAQTMAAAHQGGGPRD
jgi:hypothetical protein